MSAVTHIAIKRWWVILSLATFSSCRITQPYHQPKELVSDSLFRDGRRADTTTLADLPWKQLFTDTLLQSLISEGIKNNPDMQVALARIRQAEANFRQSGAAFFPSANANISATEQKLTAGSAGRAQLYEVYATASWEADIWGEIKKRKTRAACGSLTKRRLSPGGANTAYRRHCHRLLCVDGIRFATADHPANSGEP